jgi:hypothetical protein
MQRRSSAHLTAILSTVAIVVTSLVFTTHAAAQSLSPVQIAITSAINNIADPPPPTSAPLNVVPFEFDPNGTYLVRATWQTGIGCPQSAGCGGDPQDNRNEGLLLVKTGPTSTVAAAGARLLGPAVKGVTLTELGYDIRKPGLVVDPRGSHCGAGAPRFDVVTSDGVTHFIGCNSPPPEQTVLTGLGWIRLRWGAAQLAAAFPPITTSVSSITIIFDEGQDTGPDNFGLAVLDNIDVNGSIAGKGPTT